mmetsp:Transcript_31894/g.77721  ORF Transcript_31894/g.77721 Transcript_31894/m.77721 type:complete len:472 (-) Transcript_31894:220-1635(-)|eukprot:CAMPEP_0114507648 /NCGR_PEP_ID=MMETSP0109-20121206/12132_1 /TAXON_ID=29199 /ORGANISM="Chlorarachnion reptans, Strain CCCM449" /LENGTH=471 /DNA_ID=CAMNT_0001686435 /DNA_START=72 /DNA_END=1487 /DNA_ORIENTATION=-
MATVVAAPSVGTTESERLKKKKVKPRIGDYILGKKLGGGATAIARIGKHYETGEKVALKILWKLKENASRVRSVKAELKALGTVKHENVVRLKGVDWEGTYPHKDGSKTDAAIITLELCENGELFDYLMHTGSFSDNVARSYFHQLISGLESCHSAGVVHRDLKPDNLLLDNDFVLKIADFGFAVMPENGDMHTCVGTEKYMAPEVLKGNGYQKACDLWSCGVILFVMYAGYPPYVSPNRNDWWFDKLMKGNFKYFWMAHEQQRQFADDFKDLINQLLTVETSQRITIDGIKKHPWYVKTVLSQEDLVKELTRRKPAVDTAKLEEGLERKNNSVEFAQGMRDVSGKSLLSKMPTTPKLVEMDFKSLPEAEEYDPEVKSYTIINSIKSAPQTLQYVVSLLNGLGSTVKFTRDGYSIECTAHQVSGKVEFAIDTFKTKDGAVAEFRRLSGSFHAFRKLYQTLYTSLSKLEKQE